MGTKIAVDALAAERAAREAEGIFDPTPEQAKMLKRRTALVERRRAVDAEIDAIERAIEKDIREAGIRALHVNGKNRVLISPVTKTLVTVDEDKMREAFPEVVAAHETYKVIVTQFTETKKVPNGDRVNYY